MNNSFSDVEVDDVDVSNPQISDDEHNGAAALSQRTLFTEYETI